MNKIRTQLQGYKTYLVAASAVLAAVIAWVNGEVETANFFHLLLTAVLSVTIRAGITNEQSK